MTRRLPVAVLITAAILFVAGLLLIRVTQPAPSVAQEVRAIRPSLEARPAHLPTYQQAAEIAFTLRGDSGAKAWEQAYLAARRLAPLWNQTRREFIRQGFFHWTELSPRHRDLVLQETAAVMKDPRDFAELYRPMWLLTRDFRYLRKAAPVNIESWRQLTRLALETGEFESYRSLRSELPRIFELSLRAKITRRPSPEEILNDLLAIERTTANEVTFRTYLQWLDENHPTGAESNPDHLKEFIDFAIESGLPLESMELLAEPESRLPPPHRARLALTLSKMAAADQIERQFLTRTPEWTKYLIERAVAEADSGRFAEAQQRLARVAVADSQSAAVLATRALIEDKQGNREAADALYQQAEERFSPQSAHSRWGGLCGGVICVDRAEVITFSRTPAVVDLTLSGAEPHFPRPYVELFTDHERVSEGPVSSDTSFRVQLPAGLHRVRVRLMNPIGADGHRVVRLESHPA